MMTRMMIVILVSILFFIMEILLLASLELIKKGQIAFCP
jgi:hypothetical protein